MTSSDLSDRVKVLAAASPAAYESLFIGACLPEVTIPPEYFRFGATALGPHLSEIFAMARDDASVAVILQPLEEANFWTQVISGERLDGWRSKPEALDGIRPAFDDETNRLWAERTVKAADQYFRNSEVAAFRGRELALGCVELVKRWDFDFIEAARPLTVAASDGRLSDRKKEGEIFLRRAVEISEKHLEPTHLELADALYELGTYQLDFLRDAADAQADGKKNLLRALTIRTKSLPYSDPAVLETAYRLARICLAERQPAEARLMMDILRAGYTKSNPSLLARFLYCQAELLFIEKGPHKALDKADMALKFRLAEQRKELQTELDLLFLSDSLADYYLLLVTINSALGDMEAAARHRVRQLSVSLLALFEKPEQVSEGLLRLTQEESSASSFDVQLATAEEILAVIDEEFGSDHPGTVPILTRVGGLIFVRDGFKRAEPYFRRMMRNLEKAPDAEEVPYYLSIWGKTLFGQKEYYEAETVLQRALELLDKQSTPSEEVLVSVLDVYAAVLLRQDRPEAAAAMKSRADKLAKWNTKRFTGKEFRGLSTQRTAFNAAAVVIRVVEVVGGILLVVLVLASYFRSC